MPGWIWVLLVIFLIAVIVSGCWYAFRHLRQGLASLTPLEQAAQKDLAQISSARDSAAQTSNKPLVLSRAIGDAASDYEEAHFHLVSHRQKIHDQRDQRWARWARFNSDEELADHSAPSQKGFMNGSEKSSLS
jgi:uncharacterized membrane protein